MKRNTAIFLALGCALSAAGPLYAADSGGTTNDSAKTYQNAVDNCQKKTGAAKSRCMKSALKEKCKGLTGTAKSTCMKDATGGRPGSTEDSSGMKPQSDDSRTGSPGDAPMAEPANGSSGQSGAQTGSPNGSSKY